MSKSHYTRAVLLEMAVAVEESAKDFYDSVSKRFPQHRAVFEQLAKDEDEHAKRYRQLLAGEGVYSTGEERALADYNIKVLEDAGIIGNLRMGAERAREVADLRTAVEAAVQLEKDTSLFYHSLAMGLGPGDRQEIYKIIQVEYNHLYKVQHLKP